MLHRPVSAAVVSIVDTTEGNNHREPPRMPRSSGRGGIGSPAEQGRGRRIAAGGFGVCHDGAAPDLKPVHDLGVERPPGGLGLSGEPPVEVFGEPESDLCFFIHAPIIVVKWWRDGRV
jgi:hypothetical protein